ncbi:MAG: C-terminal helicase domain-containing protein, partial [Caldanaerobacter sp.]
ERKPTLIFSESRDTVIYIGRKLREHGNFKFEMAYGGEAPIDEETGERFEEVNKEKIEKDFNEGKFDILVTTDIMGEGVNLPRADIVINFDLHYNPVRLIQRDGRAIRINNPKKITIYNFEPDERIDKELDLCDRIAERVENIISTIGLDFLIWAVEEGKLKEISEKNRKRTIELIREYRHVLASKHPEELGKKLPPTLSKEDKALREFIKYWGISEETVEARARVYRKPIFTALEKQATTDYFVVFRYRGTTHTLGELSFSENKPETRLSKSELERIRNLIAEKCVEMDREFLKISYERKDKVTTQIEKIIEKEELKDVFEGIDVTVLPRKDGE